jgi:hypothetical protein
MGEGGSQIDIGKLTEQGYTLKINNESPEDASARRKREEEEARFARLSRLALLVFSLLLTSVIFIGCVLVLASTKSSPDDKKWAAGLVSAITSGLIGFLLGQGRSGK